MAREKVGALLILLFSISYGLLARSIPLTFLAQQETFTPRTMPYALAVMGGDSLVSNHRSANGG